MGEPFLSEIRIMSFNYAPRGWAMTNGQLLPINQNQALFALLGTTYGGNGQTTFALPDLRARVPMHEGSGHTLGERAGTDAHTLSQNEMPAHLHRLQASGTPATAQTNGPTPQRVFAASNFSQGYAPPTNLVAMSPQSLSATGGSQPHLNTQPFLTLTFCIALQGIFPSQN